MTRTATSKTALLTMSQAEDAIRGLEGRKKQADETVRRELNAALRTRFRTTGGAVEKATDSTQLQGVLERLEGEIRDQYLRMLDARIGALRALAS